MRDAQAHNLSPCDTHADARPEGPPRNAKLKAQSPGKEKPASKWKQCSTSRAIPTTEGDAEKLTEECDEEGSKERNKTEGRVCGQGEKERAWSSATRRSAAPLPRRSPPSPPLGSCDFFFVFPFLFTAGCGREGGREMRGGECSGGGSGEGEEGGKGGLSLFLLSSLLLQLLLSLP